MTRYILLALLLTGCVTRAVFREDGATLYGIGEASQELPDGTKRTIKGGFQLPPVKWEQ